MAAKAKRSRRAKGRKATAKTPAPTSELVPQPHGGAIVQGGNPGNAGGTGRPPSLIRLRCRESFEQRIPVLEQIADGTLTQDWETKHGTITVSPSFKDRTKAIEVLGKYGGVEKLTVDMGGSEEAEPGEQVMQRVLAMMGRALLSAPAAQRLAVIEELEEAELVP